MRNFMIVLWMLLCSITTAAGQVSFGIAAPGVSIGINVPVYPELVPVPGYPVYYAPRMNSNYFFYDGMYWVYTRDNWYASSWYNGPWGLVSPEVVPLFVLRVPVQYYRQRPAYFHGWVSNAPPHWGEHWGNTWEQQRSGWNNWDRSSAPPPAPLPVFQRQYSGSRYPQIEQQRALQSQNYQYQPRDAVVQQHYQAPPVQSAVAPAPSVRPPGSQARSNPPVAVTAQPQRPPQQQAVAQPQKQAPPQAVAQHAPPPLKPQVQDKPSQHKAPEPVAQHQAPQPPQAVAQHQQAQKPQGQDKPSQGKAPSQEPKQGQEKSGEKVEQHGQAGGAKGT